MDGERFDRLARALAASTSRRHLFGSLLGGALTGVGFGGVAGQGACPRDEPIRCGGDCANLRTDPSHCGRCGRACAEGQVCYAGRCMDSCPRGFLACGGTCVRDCPAGQALDDTCQCVCVPEDPAVTCAGRECGAPVNRCGEPVPCGDLGGACPEAQDCLMAVCVDGTCDTAPDPSRDGTSCGAGVVCANGACLPDLGNSCDTDADCASGYCVDDVCCSELCAGQCEACDSSGVCEPISGSPAVHGRPDCDGAETLCYGACDGINRERCAYPAAGLVCETFCDQSDQYVLTCDGAGHCRNETVTPCGLYICEDGTCLTSCQTHADCIGSAHCDSGGACVADMVEGAACDAADECQSGFCVDGVCCDSACQGECLTCDGSGFVGTCVARTDAPCDGDNLCIEGSVCDASGVCMGGTPVSCPACQSCDADTGTCMPDATRNETCPAEAPGCRDGDCVCTGAGLTCASDVQCCGTNVCSTIEGTCCTPVGEPCAGELQCCPPGRSCNFVPSLGFSICGG